LQTWIETSATIDLGFQEQGYPEIRGSTIKVVAKIEGCDEDVFQSSAMKAKNGCTILRILTCKIDLIANMAL